MCSAKDIIGQIFTCPTPDDTKKTAEFFSNFACPGSCFALYGNLGYGKTTFAMYFIQNIISEKIDVSSPTFTIIQTYDTELYDESLQQNTEIWHVDCYRLKNENEFIELGLDEAFQHNITIIEWPEIIQCFLPKNTIKIKFLLDPQNSGTRIISCF